MNKLIYAAPVLIVIILISLLLSQQINKVKMRFAPATFPYLEFREFSLNKESRKIFTSNDFPKKPMIVNIFNSTCIACIREHPQLMDLANKHGITIYGITFRDNEKDVTEFLNRHGNPYERISITSPVYDFKTLDIKSTPTSFILDSDGMIRYRHKGIMFQKTIDKIILPTIKRLEQ